MRAEAFLDAIHRSLCAQIFPGSRLASRVWLRAREEFDSPSDAKEIEPIDIDVALGEFAAGRIKAALAVSRESGLSARCPSAISRFSVG